MSCFGWQVVEEGRLLTPNPELCKNTSKVHEEARCFLNCPRSPFAEPHTCIASGSWTSVGTAIVFAMIPWYMTRRWAGWKKNPLFPPPSPTPPCPQPVRDGLKTQKKVFDTCNVHNDRAYGLHFHLDRFLKSAATARVEHSYTKEAIREIILATIAAGGRPDKGKNAFAKFWLSAGRQA